MGFMYPGLQEQDGCQPDLILSEIVGGDFTASYLHEELGG